MGTYHGVHVLSPVDDTLHQHRLRAIILEELLHLRRKLLGRVTTNSVYVHRTGKIDEVRVDHTRVGVPTVVEQVYKSAYEY